MGANLWGVHPFFINIDMADESKSHGILLLNSNGMDITFQPDKVTWRSMGGIFDFLLFLGPTPKDIVKQYTATLGRPVMVPYWSLGFQV